MMRKVVKQLARIEEIGGAWSCYQGDKDKRNREQLN